MKSYIFDACALIAYFAKENGAVNVKNILRDAIDDEDITIFMNKINLLEVYYKMSLADAIAVAESIIKCQPPTAHIRSVCKPLSKYRVREK